MAGILKVDTIQNANADNIITQTNSTTLTIGASGDTVTLAAGATSSGFGRSGTVNWDTTAKTTGFTAVSGNGYFCDTTSAAFTVTLPATPSAGDIVAIADYNGTALTNNITVGRNSSNINGSAANLTITQNYSAVTLVYVDATSGWRSVDSSNPNDIAATPEFIVATGGTITCDGDFKVHTFTGPGTFTVCSVGNPLGSTTVDYLVVAGGGGSGAAENGCGAGGGGAGGFRTNYPSPAIAGLPVTATGYPITVGAGGPGSTPPGATPGTRGSNSIFSTITSTGGGAGTYRCGSAPSRPGGSGGGSGFGAAGGTGNTPPVSPPQGNNGGTGSTGPTDAGGGGGGAGGVGGNGSGSGTIGGNGGPGSASSISGSSVTYAGGGGAGGLTTRGNGGPGGGGNGGQGPSTASGVAGTVNTGGGAGGIFVQSGGSTINGMAGGSGIVIIRYKFQ